MTNLEKFKADTIRDLENATAEKLADILSTITECAECALAMTCNARLRAKNHVMIFREDCKGELMRRLESEAE